MIGEGNVVQEIIGVVGVERAPAAVAAIAAPRPIRAPASNVAASPRGLAARPRRPPDPWPSPHGGVVDVGIMGVGVLEGPAAGAHVAAAARPVALDVEDLQRRQPVEPRAGAASRSRRRPPAGVRRERGVPDRRNAGLAIGLAGLDDSSRRSTRAPGALRMVRPACRARRTSSRCSPWPGRWRRAHPRR